MNKGKGLYDGDFSSLIKKINPTKKLFYTFELQPNKSKINLLNEKYNFSIKNNILVAQLNDLEINKLLQELFKLSNPKSFQIEDLPVEETMRSFFEKPENYL